MTVFLGDDWAEAHHDVHLMNEQGERLNRKRLPEGLDGIAALHAIVAEHANDPGEVKWIQLDLGDAADDFDHMVTTDERYRIAMARK